MSVFRVIVTPELGPSFSFYAKAENSHEAIASARSHGLVKALEKISAARVNGKMADIQFGGSDIAIGEHQELQVEATMRRQKSG
jgi:hypothetical protein